MLVQHANQDPKIAVLRFNEPDASFLTILLCDLDGNEPNRLKDLCEAEEYNYEAAHALFEQVQKDIHDIFRWNDREISDVDATMKVAREAKMTYNEEPTISIMLQAEQARILSNMLAKYMIHVDADEQEEDAEAIVFVVQTQVFDRLLELNWYTQED